MRTIIKRFSAILLAMTLMLMLPLSTQAVEATAITFERTDEMRAVLGYSYRRVAITTPAGAPVTYSSSNPDVVTVDQNGLVRTVSVGRSTITARSGSATATYDVIVQRTGIVPLPNQPHLNPVPQLMGWATNGDFGILYRPQSTSPDFPGVVTNSFLTFRNFVDARQFVIEFEGHVSLSGVHVTNIHTPAPVLSEFQHGVNLNHRLRQEGNRFIFDLAGVTHDYTERPYALYFYGIQNFEIRRVYLVH